MEGTVWEINLFWHVVPISTCTIFLENVFFFSWDCHLRDIRFNWFVKITFQIYSKKNRCAVGEEKCKFFKWKAKALYYWFIYKFSTPVSILIRITGVCWSQIVFYQAKVGYIPERSSRDPSAKGKLFASWRKSLITALQVKNNLQDVKRRLHKQQF